MALAAGHRFAVAMGEVFPHGFYALGVEQAEDYDDRTGKRYPAKDKHTGEWVWTVTGMDRDPDARDKQVKVKVTSPVMPVMPEELAPGSGLHAVEFTGLTITPYLDDSRCNGRGGRGGVPRCNARLALSIRATGVHAQGKAPTGSTSSATVPAVAGRSGGPAPTGGDGKAA